MQTLRQSISNIRGGSKLLTSDALISDRLIASELRSYANMLVTRQTDKRKLWQSSNLFTPILCLEMEKVPLTECCEYVGEKEVAKSVKMLPTIGEGIWGLAIQSVTGLDGKKFKEVTPNRYSNLLKLNLNTKDVYYWMQNNHLFVSNENTHLVNMYPYFTEDVPNDLLFPGESCNCSTPPDIADLCVNPLDKPFKIPSNMVAEVESLVIEKLNKTFLRLKEDTQSNNKQD